MRRTSGVVLIVEDHSDTRELYCEYLAEAVGAAVIGAESGEDALRISQARPPNVIVLDRGLPDIDGWELARRLKENPATTGARIIGLTGFGDSDNERTGFDAGCERVLVKPCAPGDLANVVRAALQEALAAGVAA